MCVAVLLIAAVVAVALGSKKKQIVIKTDVPQEAAKQAPNVVLKKVEYSSTNNDNFKEWDLTAESAQYMDGEKLVLLDKPVVFVYKPGGKIYRLKGKNGELNTESHDVKMHGDIVGIMPDNTTIETESFEYNHEKGLITTQDRVVIRRGDKFALEGKGMIVDVTKEKMKLMSSVKALGSK